MFQYQLKKIHLPSEATSPPIHIQETVHAYVRLLSDYVSYVVTFSFRSSFRVLTQVAALFLKLCDLKGKAVT